MSELTNALITYDDIIARTDIDILRKIAKRHGFIIYDRGNYNLNIWGIRCDITDTKHFNDLLLVFYKANEVHLNLNGKWIYDWYSITTDPSDMNLIKPINSKGCAILDEGQFQGAFKLGKHKGDYDALVQAKPLPIFRITRKDGDIEISGEPTFEMCGINIHRASKWKIVRTIGLYSAGCQVFESVRDYEDKFIPLVKKAATMYGNSFTYTLVNISDFD